MLEEAGSTTNVYYLNFNFRSTTNKCELPTYVFNCRQADKSTGTQADKSDGQIGRQRQKQITNTQRETNAQTDRGRIIDRRAGRETDTNKQTCQ